MFINLFVRFARENQVMPVRRMRRDSVCVAEWEKEKMLLGGKVQNNHLKIILFSLDFSVEHAK